VTAHPKAVLTAYHPKTYAKVPRADLQGLHLRLREGVSGNVAEDDAVEMLEGGRGGGHGGRGSIDYVDMLRPQRFLEEAYKPRRGRDVQHLGPAANGDKAQAAVILKNRIAGRIRFQCALKLIEPRLVDPHLKFVHPLAGDQVDIPSSPHGLPVPPEDQPAMLG